jgi:glucose-1-phosphate adenylyltransferase
MPGEQRILGLVLAGSPGRRLAPLTDDRAKSAVPFGGLYRLVDFALSNLVNAGIRKICVLTQYKSHSLDRHVTTTWRLNSMLGNYVAPVPAQQRLGPRWQTGSADAIYQSLNLIRSEQPDLVAVFGADDVYRMDPAQMIESHLAWGAGVTVAAIGVPRASAGSFGVVQAAADGHRIEAFLEKPASPPARLGRPDEALAAMGNYIFDRDVLVEALHADAADEASQHSIGGDIMPRLVRDGAAHVYDFLQNEVPGAAGRPDHGYWREVGTLDSYFAAHMDLCAVHPVFSLYNDRWPILTSVPPQPPAKFVLDEGDRVGRAVNSVVSNGVIVSGGLVRESVLSPGVRVEGWASVERAVVLHNVRVEARAVVRNAILDKNVVVREGAAVGVDRERDEERGFTVSAGGITVVGKGHVVEP